MDSNLSELLFFLALIPLWFIVTGVCDWDRMKSYMDDRGCRLLSWRWAPFGKGWLGEGSDRIYRIEYLDLQKNVHRAFCKTSMGSGVYLSEDKIIRPNPSARPDAAAATAAKPLIVSPLASGPHQTMAQLREENERLKREIAQLKAGQAKVAEKR